MEEHNSSLTDKQIDTLIKNAEVKKEDGNYIYEFKDSTQTFVATDVTKKEAEVLARKWLGNIPESFAIEFKL